MNAVCQTAEVEAAVKKLQSKGTTTRARGEETYQIFWLPSAEEEGKVHKLQVKVKFFLLPDQKWSYWLLHAWAAKSKQRFLQTKMSNSAVNGKHIFQWRIREVQSLPLWLNSHISLCRCWLNWRFFCHICPVFKSLPSCQTWQKIIVKKVKTVWL